MRPPTTSKPIETLSPSLAERLRFCPLRIAFEQASAGGRRSRDSPSSTVGKAVHRTIELCLGDPSIEVATAWTQACDELTAEGSDPWAAPGARRTLLRLERRLPELRTYIAARNPLESEKLQEHWLSSPDGSVAGKVDVLLVGSRPAVIDHKSGVVLDDGETAPHFQRQLIIYAWLAETGLGVDVSDGALFSLRDGIVECDVSSAVRNPVMAEILELRDAYNQRAPDEQPASPSDEACRHCQFVGACPAAWEALADGRLERFGWGDALRGTIQSPVVVAASGRAAVRFDTAVGTCRGSGSIVDVPAALVESCAVGDEFAVWKLGRRSDEPLTLAWRDGTSALARS